MHKTLPKMVKKEESSREISVNINQTDKPKNLSLRCMAHLPKIRQSTMKYAGSLGRWDDRLINQASDVPSIIFFIFSCKILCQNHFNLFFFIFL